MQLFLKSLAKYNFVIVIFEIGKDFLRRLIAIFISRVNFLVGDNSVDIYSAVLKS